MWAFTYFLGSFPDLAHPLDVAVLSFWKIIVHVKILGGPFCLEKNPSLILIYMIVLCRLLVCSIRLLLLINKLIKFSLYVFWPDFIHN